MNYRHAFHAGNFADVVKHAVLCLLVRHLAQKDKPFRVIDTHAGIGTYDLQGDEASRTGEWRDGVARVMAAANMPAVLEPWRQTVLAFNQTGQGISRYPGSPLFARAFLRDQDRLQLCELHPADAESLQQLFARDDQVSVHPMDGYMALKAFLPPKERRGLVLVDPPFEQRDEFAKLVKGLGAALSRFAVGTYALWYPLKDMGAVGAFKAELASRNIPKMVVLELWREKLPAIPRFYGTGLILINPPFTLQADLKILMPWLTDLFAIGPGAGWALKPLGAGTPAFS